MINLIIILSLFLLDKSVCSNFRGYTNFEDTESIQIEGPPTLDLPTPEEQIRVSNMSCQDSPINGFFRASMIPARNLLCIPVVDDGPEDCVTTFGEIYRLDLNGDKMKRCKVRLCGVSLCVTLRMATVRGLKLPEDGVVVLKCSPQEKVVAHTKQLRINPHNLAHEARSTKQTVLTGGTQREFNTQVALFRRGSANEFSRLVAPGAAVHLGEDLMLRATVREGDGWRFSRIGDVTMHHISPKGRLQQHSFPILDSSGCREARARVICPSDPIQPTPLVTTLELRAFMFQGMTNGDEMLLSVRILGCLHNEDCQIRPHVCGEPPRARLRRHSPQTTNSTSNIQTVLEFRVITPNITNKTHNQSFLTDNKVKQKRNDTKLYIFLCLFVLFVVIVFCLLIISKNAINTFY